MSVSVIKLIGLQEQTDHLIYWKAQTWPTALLAKESCWPRLSPPQCWLPMPQVEFNLAYSRKITTSQINFACLYCKSERQVHCKCVVNYHSDLPSAFYGRHHYVFLKFVCFHFPYFLLVTVRVVLEKHKALHDCHLLR